MYNESPKAHCIKPGLEVIKLEFILRLKIKLSDWLLADKCPQAANHCAESETVLKGRVTVWPFFGPRWFLAEI